MGEQTNISWCHHTHNHWIGCTKVSPACDGCYAEAMMDKRYGRVQWGAPGKGNGTRSLTSEANRRKPLMWNRKAEKDGARPFVFCSSLADVFDNQVPTEWRRDLIDLISKTPNLTWLLLTKRPQNILKMVPDGLPSNAALGTTVEDQLRADINRKHLAYARSALRPAFTFLSCEPMLGPIELHLQPAPNNALQEEWVITGGETDQGGHKARPTHPAWFRSLRDQCAAAGVAYHHKQNGEWVPASDVADPWRFEQATVLPDGRVREWQDDYPESRLFHPEMRPMIRIGKNRSGRLMDGVEHNAFPAVN